MNSIGTSPNSPVYRFYADDGVTPLAGGFWYTFLAGTSTPAPTYFNQDLDPGHQNTNPVVLDANGEAVVYFSPVNGTNEAVSYKWDVQDSLGVSIAGYPRDNVAVPAPSAGANLTTAVVGYGPTTTLTIAGGAITPTRNVHALNPEGGSPDDLTTIVVDNMPDGSTLYISNNNGSAPITVKNGVGNLFLSAGDYVMSTTAQRLTLIRDGASWFGVDRQSGVGDVVGPSSSTDNAVARFDGTTGKLLQNSTATLSDAGLFTAPAGTGSGTVHFGGTAAFTVTSTPNSGTSETTLWEPTIAANTLATDGDAVVVYAAGTGDTSGDTKTLRFYWNGVEILAVARDTTFDSWEMNATVTRSGATSQVVSVSAFDRVGIAVGAATLSSANTFKITGQGGSSNQVVLKQGRWEWSPHP